MSAAPHPQRGSISWRNRLSVRVVAIFVGILVVVQLITVALVHTGINDNARDNLSDQLNLGEQVFLRLLQQNADHLIDSTRVLTLDFGFRQAVSSNDQATIE